MLETYKGKIYVYSPGDYYFHYKVKVTDSLFINWNGEGPEATYIHDYFMKDSSSFKFILQSESYPNR